MRLKYRFLLISMALSCAVPSLHAHTHQSHSVLTDNTVRSGHVSGIEAWYQARQQQLNSERSDLNQLLERANTGHSDSQYELGLVYQTGRGAPQDLALAKRWFESAIKDQHVYAQYALALLLREQGGAANIQRSVKLQEDAAAGGHPAAQYGLGMLYANGQYVQQDLYQARHWLEQAKERGNMMAQLSLRELPAVQVAKAPVQATAPLQAAARPAVQQQQPPMRRVIKKPVRRAPVNNANAARKPLAGNAGSRGPARPSSVRKKQVEMAPASFNLSGVDAKQINTAAQKGDMYAQLMLGALYEDGSGGVKQDFEAALRWYLKAARQNYPKAQHNLALLYEDGRGVPQNHRQAAIWYEKAASAGFAESQNNLAVLYILGKGVDQDKAYAEQLLQQAVGKGNANAKRNLNMLLSGS